MMFLNWLCKDVGEGCNSISRPSVEKAESLLGKEGAGAQRGEQTPWPRSPPKAGPSAGFVHCVPLAPGMVEARRVLVPLGCYNKVLQTGGAPVNN